MNIQFKERLMKKWWFRWIRSYTWFSFRYWWMNYILWAMLIGLLVWLISMAVSGLNQCNEDKEINKLLQRIDRELENCCQCGIVENEVDTLSQNELLDSLREQYDACNGDITVTLAWNSEDDLDLHLVEPDGTVVYYSHPRSPNGAELDIDMNAAGAHNNENPIENICYRRTPPPGKYKVLVHFFNKNSTLSEIPYTVYVRNGSSKKYFQSVHTTVKDKHLIYEFNYPE